MCSQGDNKRQGCRKRNILYESICQLCKEDGKDVMKDGGSGEGIYVGESSRSMYKRAREHTADRDKNSEDSQPLVLQP